ncbi:6-phosphogluconolactonase [Rubripirellula amarantea]|uniref:6-phosphogluconolactonase n=1 Tax=Rubripirellula amarantea TaxID=2527999 RepID=A0A5C5WWS5_9BACT|nr:6-phosphogluconolactonase [Rubripirellula amarantea]TWT55167.1 6-phosphogluconolactonase [Rubripirellula amarantea]
MNIETFTELPQLQLAVADSFCELVDATLSSQDAFRVSLSGGSTPKRIYEILADRDLPWDQIHFYWGDERNVPHDHDESNAKMVRGALLTPADVPETNIHTVPVKVDDPAAAAREYEALLREHFAGQAAPQWDLVLLGMGDDAHTASLFPGTQAIEETDRWFVENFVKKFDAYRYTLTAPAINSGREKWFLIAGENKRDALAKVWSDTRLPNEYPSQLVEGAKWFVNSDAMPKQS